MAEPFQRFRPAQREQIEKYLAALGVGPGKTALPLPR